MTLEYRKHITRDQLQAEPLTLFVFGDNMQRVGLGGQAAEMRGEPNAVGIPTKWAPGMAENDFFKDEDFTVVQPTLFYALEYLFNHRGKIVWPADGIGTGLAQLPQRAPHIWSYIENSRKQLEDGVRRWNSPPEEDLCFYCGMRYHPMLRWTKSGAAWMRYACAEDVQKAIIDQLGTTEVPSFWRGMLGGECAQQAKRDGYVPRPDLTPSR